MIEKLLMIIKINIIKIHMNNHINLMHLGQIHKILIKVLTSLSNKVIIIG
jgi:hypothetical protein